MNSNYLLLRLFGISAYCLVGIVAREAIVGGYKAETLRYQASILVADRETRCGGGIIDEHFVLTAAHCVIAENDELIGLPTSVLVGTRNLAVAGVVVEVEKIFVPQEYNPRNLYSIGDIAVLKLKKPLEMEKHNLAYLFLPKYNNNSRYENKTVRIAGFGWDKIYENNELIGEHTDNELRFADATVRNDIECKHDHLTINLDRRHLCARVKQYNHIRRGVCVGDGGGPLVLRGNTVLGILSVTTIGCAEKTSSGIYTRVSYYREFVEFAKKNIEVPIMRIINI